jgi:hypothetical protein
LAASLGFISSGREKYNNKYSVADGIEMNEDSIR